MQILPYLIPFAICTSMVYTEQCDLLKFTLLPGIPEAITAASECNTKTNIQFFPPEKPLSMEEHKILCQKCPSLIDAAAKLNLPDCSLVVGNQTNYGNLTLSKVFDNVIEACESLKNSSKTLDASKEIDASIDSAANVLFVHTSTLTQFLLGALLILVIAS